MKPQSRGISHCPGRPLRCRGTADLAIGISRHGNAGNAPPIAPSAAAFRLFVENLIDSKSGVRQLSRAVDRKHPAVRGPMTTSRSSCYRKEPYPTKRNDLQHTAHTSPIRTNTCGMRVETGRSTLGFAIRVQHAWFANGITCAVCVRVAPMVMCCGSCFVYIQVLASQPLKRREKGQNTPRIN